MGNATDVRINNELECTMENSVIYLSGMSTMESGNFPTELLVAHFLPFREDKETKASVGRGWASKMLIICTMLSRL